jgi:hypothetical protein
VTFGAIVATLGAMSDRDVPRLHPPLSPNDLRRIALEAGVVPQTVKRYLNGKKTCSTTADRIRRALEALGFADVRRP